MKTAIIQENLTLLNFYFFCQYSDLRSMEIFREGSFKFYIRNFLFIQLRSSNWAGLRNAKLSNIDMLNVRELMVDYFKIIFFKTFV